jgi:hypothetical protein
MRDEAGGAGRVGKEKLVKAWGQGSTLKQSIRGVKTERGACQCRERNRGLGVYIIRMGYSRLVSITFSFPLLSLLGISPLQRGLFVSQTGGVSIIIRFILGTTHGAPGGFLQALVG